MLFDGQLTVRAQSGAGTQVTIRLPLPGDPSSTQGGAGPG
jgi:hypothetical protein